MYLGIAGEKNNAVAGLINFMRNIGSSVGTSMVVTIIARRAQFHQHSLGENASMLNSHFNDAIQGTASKLAESGLSAPEAHQQALARFYHSLGAQASTLAYIDTYWILAVCAAIMFGLSFILAKNDPHKAGKASLH